MNAELIHVVKFMPEKTINNKEYLESLIKENPELLTEDMLLENPFFKGVEERRFASPKYTSVDLGELAVKKLLKETDVAAAKIDLIICSCIFNDSLWPGIGTAIQARIGANHSAILHLDTSMCSFISALNAAQAFIKSGTYKKIVIVTVTNFISRLEEFQKSPRSFVLGDGATATLIQRGEIQSILSICEKSFGEHYGLVRFEPDLVEEGIFRNYWERGSGPITVNFNQKILEKLTKNAIALIPKMINLSLDKIKISKDKIDCFITHQPNEFFIKKWREILDISEEKTHNTLKKYGNLFHGSIAVTLADALEIKRIKKNDLVAMSAFSNGGDYGASAVLKI